MAKTRAQRKAERRKREQRQAAQRSSTATAQHDTQVPESADVLEAELAEQGADIDALREEGEQRPEAPAPSRADVGKPAVAGEEEAAEAKTTRRERKRAEREERQRAKESADRRRPRDEPVERQRGRVVGFLVSCWAELKRVQWPDRDTLIQASAVTLIFIAVAATYLGALDAVFNQVIKLIL